jgi:hypothetical protein
LAGYRPGEHRLASYWLRANLFLANPFLANPFSANLLWL